MTAHVSKYMTAMPQTIGSNSDIKKARELMVQNACNHLPVLDGGKLVGLVSIHDISLMLLTSTAKDAKVSQIMSTDLYIVEPDASLKTVAAQMLERNINSAIVQAKGNSPWGIFTSTDALKYVAGV